jgi:hypothetical protein
MNTDGDEQRPGSWADESLPLATRRQILAEQLRRLGEEKGEAQGSRETPPALQQDDAPPTR